MTDWSGRDYAEISGLQRGDGFLTRAIAVMVPEGYAVGVDASPRMIATAHTGGDATPSGPWFAVGDARRLPFTEFFDAVVSFNALHWVPEQRRALSEIATVLRPHGRALIQVVCAGRRASLESVAMSVAGGPRWAQWFAGFSAVHTRQPGRLPRAGGLGRPDSRRADGDRPGMGLRLTREFRDLVRGGVDGLD